MKRYLILENGFDSEHKLPTSHKDSLYICVNIINVGFKHNYDEKKCKMDSLLDVFKTASKSFYDDI